jgi:hypothetical protein
MLPSGTSCSPLDVRLLQAIGLARLKKSDEHSFGGGALGAG